MSFQNAIEINRWLFFEDCSTSTSPINYYYRSSNLSIMLVFIVLILQNEDDLLMKKKFDKVFNPFWISQAGTLFLGSPPLETPVYSLSLWSVWEPGSIPISPAVTSEVLHNTVAFRAACIAMHIYCVFALHLCNAAVACVRFEYDYFNLCTAASARVCVPCDCVSAFKAIAVVPTASRSCDRR